MSDVFISYSRKDTDFVRRLFEALRAENREAWVDWQGIDYSTKWWEEICEGIEKGDNFLLIITPDSLNSMYCHQEIEHARRFNKRIIPVIHRDIDEKTTVGGWYKQDWETLARDNWEYLRTIQYIQFRESDDFPTRLRELLETIDVDPEHVETHTRLLMWVREWEKSARNPSHLLRGDDLRQMESWLAASADKDPRPSEEQRAYLAASRQAEDALKAEETRRERRIRQFRWAALLLGLMVVAAIIAGVVISRQVVEAQDQLATVTVEQGAAEEQKLVYAQSVATLIIRAATAESQVEVNSRLSESLRLAAASSAITDISGNSNLPLLLGIRAMYTGYSTQADVALQRAMEHPASQEFLGHTSEVASVAFSPDGQYALIGSSDSTARLWRLDTGEEVRRLLGHTGGVSSVAVSPDGQYALTGSSDSTARLWRLDTGEEVRRFEGDMAAVRSVAFSPDGQYVLTGSDDSTARLWRTGTGEEIRRLVGHTETVTSVAFSPDGQYALTGSADTSVRLWRLDTGEEARQLGFLGSAVWSVAFSPSGHYALIGSADRTVRLWRTDTGEEVSLFNGHTEAVKSVAFSPDGSYILTGSSDKTARLWKLDTDKQVQWFAGSRDDIRGAAFSPDGQYALTGSQDNIMRLWRLETGEQVGQFAGHASIVMSMAISPDRQYMLAVQFQDTARLWRIDTGEEVRQFASHAEDVLLMVFSPDGQYALTGAPYVLSGPPDTTARLWRIDTGEEVRQFVGHTSYLTSIAISPDGQYALTGSSDSTARLWRIDTGEEVHRFVNPSSVSSVAFSADGQYVLTATGRGGAIVIDDPYGVTRWGDSPVRLWRVDTGEQVRQFVGDMQDVNHVAFSPDGKYIVGDSPVRLWRVDTGEQVRQFVSDTQALVMAFSTDGKDVLTISNDLTSRLWEIDAASLLNRACARAARLRDFTAAERQQYGLDDSPTCPQFEAGYLSPTPSPNYAGTPVPTSTIPPTGTRLPLTPTVDLTRLTATLTPTETFTPTPTPTLILLTMTLAISPYPTPTIPVWTPIASPTPSLTPG